MINRELIRLKLVQVLYSHLQKGSHNPDASEKELLLSLDKAYDLYNYMLLLMVEVGRMSVRMFEVYQNRSKKLNDGIQWSRKFVDNRFILQLESNKQLRAYCDEQALSWADHEDFVRNLYYKVEESDFYKEYMAIAAPTYEDEKALWRKIYGQLLLSNEALISALEEMEVALDYEGWTIDIDMVLTYVVKTIKRMKEDDSDELPLLEMFASEEEFSFAKELMQKAMEQADENKALISKALQNWEADRVAYMDQVILLVALAEIREFHSIALEISMNEYIEIAKEYSSEKSYVFINGVLNKVVNDLRAENQLFKFTRN